MGGSCVIELEKVVKGLIYDVNFDEMVLVVCFVVKWFLYCLNVLFLDVELQWQVLFCWFLVSVGEWLVIEGLFYCDYGFNICIGRNFYVNVNFVIFDGVEVSIGDNVFIVLNVGIYMVGYLLDFECCNVGLEYVLFICIGNDVWIGGGVSILFGVIISDGVVIGVGVVVMKDVLFVMFWVGNFVWQICLIIEDDVWCSDFICC